METIDGTAQAPSDYTPLKCKVCFNEQETLKQIYIEIIDDDVWEPDEFFYAKLFVDAEDEKSNQVTIGKIAINQITIINDDRKYAVFVVIIFQKTKHKIFIIMLF